MRADIHCKKAASNNACCASAYLFPNMLANNCTVSCCTSGSLYVLLYCCIQYCNIGPSFCMCAHSKNIAAVAGSFANALSMCALIVLDKRAVGFVLLFNILFTLKMCYAKLHSTSIIAQHLQFSKNILHSSGGFLQACEQGVRTTHKNYFAVFTKACGQVFRTT